MAVSSEAGADSPREMLVMTRIFDAPRSLVFKMWTDPKHMAQWWGPSGFTTPVCEVDARPGGAMRIVMRSPDGLEHVMSGVFREVVEPERLAFTNIALDRDGNRLLEGFTTVTFEEQDGKTKLTLETSAAAQVPEAFEMLKGMEEGWSQSLVRLQALCRRS
ncbi:MAG TPA: SRPBCC domain-containing protein [Candidatus Binataceae bacterium]|jgi:uncharacterized protein YndB with AHSA1/START domain|nr:SRPBCC domain-containing protein [Candidatus Binataceae bacterium]